ncbi:MAG: M6 family metalloprotease domain-containing protein [Bacteroidota bacterium]|nr:M6 family metalloprotease domain-containing protein [Bacteroidota bacterium]
MRITTAFRTLFVSCTLFAGALSYAAPVTFVPVTVLQPDGAVLHCYASGDEYYNWLHDEDGYTIIQDDQTGYYVYATESAGRLVPTAHIAGRSDPTVAGLRPWLRVREDLLSSYPFFKKSEGGGNPRLAAPTKGTFYNIVVFIRFSDENEFPDSLEYYEAMYNRGGANSMLAYYREVSYNALTIRTEFFPRTAGVFVTSFQDSLPRAYYKPYNATTNPDGYTNDSRTREENLIIRALEFIRPQVPDTLVLDADKDGVIDNMSFIISGQPTAWATLLWPHMTTLGRQFIINGARVGTYNLLIESFFKTGRGVDVICHEMFHSLGAPDLYHYSSNGLTPVGKWDIMESTINPPQHMGAYMKWKYGKWIPSIPEIRTAGVYTLSPLTSPTNNCFRIASPYSTTEYFVVEYRKRNTGLFDNTIPGDGLLVYRINTLYRGNASGPPDEVYLYRPGGSPTTNGQVDLAHFSREQNRTEINDGTNPSSFLTNGKKGGLNIHSIGSAGPTISFEIGLDTMMIQLTSPLPGSQWNIGERKRISWLTNAVDRKVLVEYSTNGGRDWHVIAAPATAAFYWTVPNTPSRHCRFRISDITNPLIRDSCSFSICPKFYRVVFNHNVTDTTNVTDNFGVTFVKERFWTSRAGSDFVAEWTRDGKLLGEFIITGAVTIKSFTTDGTYIYAATGSDRIAVIDPEQRKRINLIRGPMQAEFVSYDPTADGGKGGMWIGKPGSDIVLISMQGTELARLDSAALGEPSITAIAFDGWSPGGPYLWTFARSATGKSQFLTQLRLPSCEPTGLFHDVLQDIGSTTIDGIAGGLTVSTEIIPGKVVLCGTLLGVPNRLFGYQLPADAPTFLFEENFPYAASAKVTDHGWNAIEGSSLSPILVADKGLFYPEYISSNIGRSVRLIGSQGNNQDVAHTFPQVEDGGVYAAFLLDVSSAPQGSAPIFALAPSPGAAPAAVVFLGAGEEPGTYRLGVGRTTDPATATFTVKRYGIDSTLLIACKHRPAATGTDDTLALWVDPPLTLIEPPADILRRGINPPVSVVSCVELLQSASPPYTCRIDGIRVGTTWDEAVGRGTGRFALSVLVVDATDEKQEPFKTLGVADSTVDAFYRKVFQPSAEWDVSESNIPKLDYLLRYQLVVWHADHREVKAQPYIAAQDVVDVLQAYVDAGGCLLIGGWRHLAWFDAGRPFPRTYGPGSFVHDFLHVGVIDETAADTADFLRGEGKSGFTTVSIDPTKIPNAPYRGMLDCVALFPATVDSVIVMFTYANSPQSGRPEYRGIPVAVHAVTPTSNVFAFGFPLYFLPLDQACRLAEEILERVSVTAIPLTVERENRGIPSDGWILGQNYPNPFRFTTTIPFALRERSSVTVEVFDALGRKAAVLYDGMLDAGAYTVRWSPRLPAGMYIAVMTLHGERNAVSRKTVHMLLVQ